MIRVLIADDHEMARDGLGRIIEGHADLKIVAEASDGEGVLSALDEHEVDVLVLDLKMPGPGFMTVMEQMAKEHPDTRVLVVSMYSEGD